MTDRKPAAAPSKPSWARRHRNELGPFYAFGWGLLAGAVAKESPDGAKYVLAGAAVVVFAALLLTRSWVDRKRERVVVVLGVVAVAAWMLVASKIGVGRETSIAWAALCLIGGVLWWTDWFQTGKTRKAKGGKSEPGETAPRTRAGAWHTDSGLTAAFTEAGLLRPGKDGEPTPAPRAIGRPDTDDYGTTVRVRLPRGVRYSQVAAARESLAAALDQPVHLVTISQLRNDPAGVARIRVSEPYERTIRTHALPEGTTWREPVTIGRDRRGRDVTFPTWNIGQVLVGGRTGSGKTHFLRLLASHYALDPEAELYIVDGKGSTDDWGPLRPRCKRLLFIHDDDPAARFKDLIEHVQGIVTDRNRAGGRDYPGVLVVLEEFSSLLAALDAVEKKDMERAVTRLVQTCRSANVMVVIAAQRPSASTMDTNTRAQAAVSVALAMKSPTDITMVLGHTPTLELPDEPGEAIVVVPGRDDVFVDLDTIPDGDWEDMCASWKPTPAPPAPTGVPEAVQPSLALDFDLLDAEPIEYARPIPVADDHVLPADDDDDLYPDAVALVTTTQYATRQMLSRKLRVGWANAGALIAELEAAGVIGPEGEDGRHEVLTETATESPVAVPDVREPPEEQNGPENGTGEPEQPGPANAVEAVMHCIERRGGDVASSAIQIELDHYSRSSIKTALAKLVADGRIVRVRQGYYRIKETIA